MPRAEPAPLAPRKAPQQTRSGVTVDAIHTATIQVLLANGATRLTTTRVAVRAGVSVGTLYQYYPNKQALLLAVLERHLGSIERAMLAATARLAGGGVEAIARGLAEAWLLAKTADIPTSRALYAIAAEFDIAALMAAGVARLRAAIAALLATAPDARFADAEATAFMLMALLGGSVRAVMEVDAGDRDRDLDRLRQELPRACLGYLRVASD